MPTILELFSSKLIETPNGLSETAEKGVDSQKKTYKINNVATDGTDISGPIRAFNTLQLKDGKTARFTTDINNRPFSKIDTSNIFLKNTSFPLVNKLKSGRFAKKDNETFTEEELTGLRPLQLLSQPVLYGTDIVKMTLKEARSTRKMKLGTYPSTTGVDEAKVPSVEANSAKMIQSKVYTPTGLFLNDEFRAGKILDKPGLFSKLRGTPEQLLLQLALYPIDTLKKLTSPNGTKLNKTSKDANTEIIVKNSNTGNDGNPLELFKYNTLSFDTDDDRYTKQLREYGDDKDKTDLAGKLANILLSGIELSSNGFISSNAAKTPFKIGKSKYKGIEKKSTGETTGYKYTSTLLNKTDARGDKVFEKDLSLGGYRGMENGEDFLNTKTILNEGDDIKIDSGPYKDLATLKFQSVATGQRVRFRATISGLTETFTPSWESNKFVGNPFNFYTYNSIERSVTFTFKIFSLNYEEHKRAWIRLSFLSSLVYPQSYINKNYVTPPFIKFTLGDMYKDKEAFIESLTYTIDDNTPWEIGLEQKDIKYEGEDTAEPLIKDYYISATTAERSTTGTSYILPKIIEVAMTLKLVETPNAVYDVDGGKGSKVLYGFTDSNITNNILAALPEQKFGDDKKIDNTDAAGAGKGNNVAGAENASQNSGNANSSTGQLGTSANESNTNSTNKFGQNAQNSIRKTYP
jgi:hypothetical protein